MSQFSSSFWDWYIGVITVLAIIACGVFLKMQSVRRVPGSGTQTTGHTWDENLGEYNNPLPRWWMWLFYITIVFGLTYLYLYPGLGSYRGSLGWTQVGQLQAEMDEANRQYGPLYEKFSTLDPKELSTQPEAVAIGQKLFMNHCAQCHASDGAGSKGFPNLTDKDWLYGGTPEVIKTTISQGRQGIMPALGAALGEQGTKNVAHYVLSLSGSTHDTLRASQGQALFAQSCAACHGAEGKGNTQLGAPNLTETISKGRHNVMPAHQGLLSEAKIHLLTGYVLSLSMPVAAKQ